LEVIRIEKMKLRILVCLLFFSAVLFSQEYRSDDTRIESSNLPIVIIDTNGLQIQSQCRISAKLGIIDNGQGTVNHVSDPFNDYDGKISIKIRGGSSTWFPKKQFSIETQNANGSNNNVSLLGLPEENDWILYAPYSDKTLIRNALTFTLANDIGYYASRFRFCNVIINGNYKGVYVLLEKIKRDKNRVDISKLNENEISGDELTGGYILQIDRLDESNIGWQSLPFYPGADTIDYLVEYPKAENLQPEQLQYVQDYINEFEIVCASDTYNDPETGYYNYIDINTFVHVFIINELSKNIDGYRYSSFLYKDCDSIDGRIKLGPVWDYNLAFCNASYYEGYETQGWQIEYNYPDNDTDPPFWLQRIWDDEVFRNIFYTNWHLYRQTTLSNPNLSNLIDDLVEKIGAAQIQNFNRWPILNQYVWPNPYIGGSFEQEISHLKSWIWERAAWIDENAIFDSSLIDLSNLKINEFLAANNNILADENGDYDDWIEIYNDSCVPLDLAGLYITDDLSNPTKYQLPYFATGSTLIHPHKYKILWADDETEEGLLHLNFKLCCEGEEIGIFLPENAAIIDSICYLEQTQDISCGRLGDGNDDWGFFCEPTPDSPNCSQTSSQQSIIPKIMKDFNVFPNPFNPITTIQFNLQTHSRIKISIINIKGQCVRILEDSELARGTHTLIWNGINETGNPVCSGIYLVLLEIENQRNIRKCLLLK
jgi:CotH kinase protein/Secretion system C-terminal sorting domain